MAITKEVAIDKLKIIAENGLNTRNGVEKFVLTFDVNEPGRGVSKRVGLHGRQFYMDHINKFTSVLNKCECQFWIYPSDLVPGHTMLVVDFFE